MLQYHGIVGRDSFEVAHGLVAGPERVRSALEAAQPLASDRSDWLADLEGVDPVLLEMVETFTQRTLAGEAVDVDELLAGYPAWDAAFRKLLPALRRLAALDKPQDSTPKAPRDPESAQGRIFGDFQIVREIARGGMGVVYEAKQVTLSRTVALKVLPLAASLDPRALQRFQLEAQVAGLLQHPGIVPVHAVGMVEDTPYYAMQFIEGGSLAELITATQADRHGFGC